MSYVPGASDAAAQAWIALGAVHGGFALDEIGDPIRREELLGRRFAAAQLWQLDVRERAGDGVPVFLVAADVADPAQVLADALVCWGLAQSNPLEIMNATLTSVGWAASADAMALLHARGMVPVQVSAGFGAGATMRAARTHNTGYFGAIRDRVLSQRVSALFGAVGEPGEVDGVDEERIAAEIDVAFGAIGRHGLGEESRVRLVHLVGVGEALSRELIRANGRDELRVGCVQDAIVAVVGALGGAVRSWNPARLCNAIEALRFGAGHLDDVVARLRKVAMEVRQGRTLGPAMQWEVAAPSPSQLGPQRRGGYSSSTRTQHYWLNDHLSCSLRRRHGDIAVAVVVGTLAGTISPARCGTLLVEVPAA